MWESWVQSLGREDPLEKEMATHSSILAWKIPWREEPGGLQFMGSQRVGHDWVTSLTKRNEGDHACNSLSAIDVTLLGHPSPPHHLSQANLLSVILCIKAYLHTFQAAGSPGIKILRRRSQDPDGTPIRGGSSPCWQGTGWVGEGQGFFLQELTL